MHNAELFLGLTVVESGVYYLLSFRAGDCKDHFRHSEPAQAGEESPGWLRQGNDKHFSKHAVILALRAGIPRLVAVQ